MAGNYFNMFSDTGGHVNKLGGDEDDLTAAGGESSKASYTRGRRGRKIYTKPDTGVKGRGRAGGLATGKVQGAEGGLATGGLKTNKVEGASGGVSTGGVVTGKVQGAPKQSYATPNASNNYGNAMKGSTVVADAPKYVAPSRPEASGGKIENKSTPKSPNIKPSADTPSGVVKPSAPKKTPKPLGENRGYEAVRKNADGTETKGVLVGNRSGNKIYDYSKEAADRDAAAKRKYADAMKNPKSKYNPVDMSKDYRTEAYKNQRGAGRGISGGLTQKQQDNMDAVSNRRYGKKNSANEDYNVGGAAYRSAQENAKKNAISNLNDAQFGEYKKAIKGGATPNTAYNLAKKGGKAKEVVDPGQAAANRMLEKDSKKYNG